MVRLLGAALSIQFASSSAKKYLLCARQSGSSGAGVTALEREPATKRQRDPPFPRAARGFKCKMRAYAHRRGGPPSSRPLSPSPYNAAVPKGPAFSFLNYYTKSTVAGQNFRARAREPPPRTPARSVNGGRSHAHGERHNAGSLNRPDPPPPTRTAALSCRSRSTVRLRCAHVPTSLFQRGHVVYGVGGVVWLRPSGIFFVVFEAARAWRSGASSLWCFCGV